MLHINHDTALHLWENWLIPIRLIVLPNKTVGHNTYLILLSLS